MLANLPKLKAIVAATAVTVTYSLPGAGAAQQHSADALLQDLAVSELSEAAAIDRELQALWAKSGSPAMDLLLRRGTDALERGDLQQAAEHLTALTDHAPEFARGWYERARVYFALGLYGPSVADLERALALNPMDYNAIYALGALFEQFRNPERAYQAYQRAKAIHPHHEDVSSALERLAPLAEGREL
ncbi:tetratricopeptide repeat protein [Leisingera sp. M527]|uniref:tetratricopeptide repeat protein n=1 Tax=unclassified Leisingera TaxID=2614906 RepID=UPI0021A877A7|nr:MULTISPECIES: tetratricopeptide repeat protein [unclassified Leisingera]UWQ31666.1 tetratricopeptide repeat protein [Leisingera sp. M527]UWQ73652.1 tetratricopeptide repeat protein [Leisingera sp. M658]